MFIFSISRFNRLLNFRLPGGGTSSPCTLRTTSRHGSRSSSRISSSSAGRCAALSGLHGGDQLHCHHYCAKSDISIFFACGQLRLESWRSTRRPYGMSSTARCWSSPQLASEPTFTAGFRGTLRLSKVMFFASYFLATCLPNLSKRYRNFLKYRNLDISCNHSHQYSLNLSPF